MTNPTTLVDGSIVRVACACCGATITRELCCDLPPGSTWGAKCAEHSVVVPEPVLGPADDCPAVVCSCRPDVPGQLAAWRKRKRDAADHTTRPDLPPTG